MSNITEASDWIKRQAVLYKGFVAAAEALDRVGSLEQAATEAQKTMEKAQAASQAAEKELAAIRKEIAEAESLAPGILVAANESAKTKAADIVSRAEEKAESIIAQAEGSAQRITDDINARRMVALNDIESFQAQAEELKSQVEAAKSEVAGLQKDHDKLTKAIEALKFKFQ